METFNEFIQHAGAMALMGFGLIGVVGQFLTTKNTFYERLLYMHIGLLILSLGFAWERML